MWTVALALAGYVACALVMTWPLAASLGSRLPYDLGDPLLNCWILAWQIRQFGRLLHGDVSVLGEWWHGNIFHPSPYALGYSEVLVVPALMGWPVLAATGNLLLTYNLLFLAAFVLSGLFTFLLVRALTGHAPAAWVAGLLFAFAPTRFDHGSHLQAQFACWMPLVLWQVERLAATGRWRHAGATGLSLAALNLSNGYYQFFFAPWVAAWALLSLWRHGRLADARRWMGLGAAAALALALTLPGMAPYLALRAQGAQGRTLAWVQQYSATPASWMSATPWLRVWGWLDASGRPENDLFPGLVPIAGIVLALAWWRRHAAGQRVLLAACLLATVLGVWWSFGPYLRLGNQQVPGIYLLLFRYVPGFDALRVPTRIATVVSLWTAVIAGIAIATAWRARVAGDGRRAAGTLVALSALVLVDAAVVPMRMHDVLHAPHFRQQSPHVEPVPAAAPLARALARLPKDAVLVHLPFGPLSLEVRYMYASTGHWRRLVNGYSGDFPASYQRWKRDLEALPDRGPDAERALRESGATHVVLHEEYLGPDRTAKLHGWLTQHLGAERLASPGPQIVYRLRPQG